MDNYNKPPIEEALCELTFTASAPTGQWDLTLPGRMRLHERLKDIYTGVPRQQHVQEVVSAPAGPEATQQRVALSTALLRVLMPTSDGKALLGIGPNSLLVSVLRPYEGWDAKFRDRIEQAVAAYFEVAQPPPVMRIVLKYINRLVVPIPDTGRVDDYLIDLQPSFAARTKADEDIRANLSAFNTRKEYATTDGERIIVTQATIDPQNKLRDSEYLLDIEVIWDRAPLSSITDIMSKIDRLHLVEGAVFEALIKPPARELFNAAN